MRNVLRVFATVLVLLALIEFAHGAAPTPPLAFRSDGCSYWFDGNWYDCCYAHDLDYWIGGTFADRAVADAKLQRCIARKGQPVNAWLMHTFVRALGGCWIPWSHRWGAGWPWPQCGPA